MGSVLTLICATEKLVNTRNDIGLAPRCRKRELPRLLAGRTCAGRASRVMGGPNRSWIDPRKRIIFPMSYETYRVEITRDETRPSGKVTIEIAADIDRMPETNAYRVGLLTLPEGCVNQQAQCGCNLPSSSALFVGRPSKHIAWVERREAIISR
jgi:hypothetical protein